MHPTSRPSRPLSWTTRRELAERLHHRGKGPLQPLQSLQSLQTLQELQALQRIQLDWAHVGRPDIIFYSPKQIQHLIRLDTALGRAAAMGTPPPMWHDRRIPGSTHSPYESGGGRSPPEVRPWNEWGNVASGWAAGAVLLLAALLLVRYIDRCLAKKLLNLRRRQSEEWPTPNVLATSHRFPNDGDDDSIPRLSDFDGASETNRELRSNDLPPPYSECARPARRQANKHIVTIEEPPPPYSACYVAFSNPKDGVPSVHLYNGQGQSLSDAQNPTAANGADKPDGCDTSNNRSVSARTHAVVDRDVPSTSNGCVANTNSHIVDIDKDTIPEEVC